MNNPTQKTRNRLGQFETVNNRSLVVKSTRKVDSDGNITWTLPDGRLHHENGPAIIDSNGCRDWWFMGRCLVEVNSNYDLKKALPLLRIKQVTDE